MEIWNKHPAWRLNKFNVLQIFCVMGCHVSNVARKGWAKLDTREAERKTWRTCHPIYSAESEDATKRLKLPAENHHTIANILSIPLRRRDRHKSKSPELDLGEMWSIIWRNLTSETRQHLLLLAEATTSDRDWPILNAAHCSHMHGCSAHRLSQLSRSSIANSVHPVTHLRSRACRCDPCHTDTLRRCTVKLVGL